MKTKTLVFIALGLSLGSAASVATDSGFYMGTGVGQSDVSRANEFGITDDTDTAFRVYGGYQFNRWIAAEAAYIDFGSFTGGIPSVEGPIRTRLDADGYTIGLRPQVDFGSRWFAQAQAGALFWDAKARLSGAGFDQRFSDHGEDAYYGLGVGRHVGNNWRVSAEWTRFDTDSDVDLMNLSLSGRFGK